MPVKFSSNFHFAFALLVGMSIPTIIFGRAVFASVVGLGFVALLASELRQVAWPYLTAQRKSLAGMVVIVTIVAWAISASGSVFPLRSLEAVLRTGLFVCIGVMIFAGLRGDRYVSLFSMRTLLVVSAISTLLGILWMTVLPELYWFLRMKGWVSIPLRYELKNFSSLIVILLPILTWRLVREKFLFRFLALVTLAGLGFLVWETYNRAAIAGLLAILLAWTFASLVRRGTRKHIFTAFIGVCLIFISVAIWLEATRKGMSEIAPGDDWLFPVWLIDFQRQTIWAHTLDIFERVPWLGIGANTINFTPGADAPMPGDKSLHLMPAHPHSWFFEVLAETGTIGLVLMLTTIGTITYHLLQKFRQTGETGYLAALTIMAGYWASGFFNYSYWSAWWQVCFVVGMALALAFRTDTGDNP